MSVNSKCFRTIQSQFLCCFPIKKIEWQETLHNITWEDQTRFIDETVRLPELHKYPLQTKYIVRFLRYVIDTLESQQLDVHDDIYTILCEYQSGNDLTTDSYSYKHYRIRLEDSLENVILKENNNKISHGTTGLNVWESALVLAEWVLINKSYFPGKCILELGAGTGLASLVIGKCCSAKSIKVTDGNDKVIEILEENFVNNIERKKSRKFVHSASETEIDVLKLDWVSRDEKFVIDNFKEIDLIIAADIIYDNTLFKPLLETVVSIFKHSPNCEKLLLVNAVRNPDTEKEFLNMLATFGLEHCIDPTPCPKYLHWEQTNISPIKMYSIRPIQE